MKLIKQNTICLLLTVLISSSISGYAQLSHFPIQTLSINNGLSQSSVTTVMKDHRGFLWVGTYDGLNRYDGKQITIFTAKENSNRHLSSGTILDIAEDTERDLIYFGTSGGGLNVFDPQKETFTHLRHSEEHNSILSDFIYDLVVAPNGDVWMATNLGISCYSPDKRVFTNYPVQKDETGGFPYASAVSLLFTQPNVLWVGTYGSGLVRFDLDSHNFTLYENDLDKGDHFNRNTINDLEHSHDGNIIVASDGGLYYFDIDNEEYAPFLFSDNVSRVVKGQDEDYWVAIRENGIRHIRKDGTIHPYLSSSFDPKSLPEDFIISLYLDTRNHLWIGTKNQGLWQMNLNAKPFMHYYHVPGENSLLGSSMFGLAQDEYNNVWIGAQEGLTHWNLSTNVFTPVDVLKDGRLMSVWALYYEKPNSLWLGTSFGAMKYDIITKNYEVYSYDEDDPASLSNDEVFAFEKDKLGRLWIGTVYGLNRFIPEEKRFKRYPAFGTSHSLSHPTIWNIDKDSKGRLWISTAEGLNLYNYETDDFTIFKHRSGDSLSISDSYVNSVFEDSQNRIWVATRQGINIFNDKFEVVRQIDLGQGIANAYVYSLLEQKGNVWASTNFGLARINTTTFQVENFNVNDGLQANEFNIAALKLADDRLIFGGINGLSVFHSDSITRSDFVPPIYFTGLKLYERDISPRDTTSWHDIVIRTSIINARTLKLSPQERVITLEFAALDFDGPDRINYFYRLLPNTKDWIPLRNKNFLTFINLNPGKYELEIKSTNADGLICDNVKSLKIEVKPPLWKEAWFIAMEFLFLFLFVYLIVRYRMHRLKRDKERLEAVVESRTREIEVQRNVAHKQRDEIARQKVQLEEFAKGLEEKVKDRTRELEKAKVKAEESDRLKSAFLSNMSHEIRTPMNAIIGFSELLLEPSFEEKERIAFAQMIKTNGDTLLNLLSDIIDISMIESGQLKTSHSETNVNQLMNTVHATFSKTNVIDDKSSVELILDCTDQEIILDTDPLRLTQILNNLLGNALKFTEQGFVKLGCQLVSDQWIEFYVEDSGIGIDLEYQKQIFDRFLKVEEDKDNLYRGSGLGLTITKNLVELLDGTIGLESEKGKGSRFFFRLPFNSLE